jgi:hypothetical protein
MLFIIWKIIVGIVLFAFSVILAENIKYSYIDTPNGKFNIAIGIFFIYLWYEYVMRWI